MEKLSIDEKVQGVICIRFEDGLLFGSVRYSQNPRATKAIAIKRAKQIIAMAKLADITQTLMEYLSESHAEEKDAQHYGDKTCSYCAAIKKAEKLLKEYEK